MSNNISKEILRGLEKEVEETYQHFNKAAGGIRDAVSELTSKISELRHAYRTCAMQAIDGDAHWANDSIRLLKDIDNAIRDAANAASLKHFPPDKLYRAISKAERSLSVD